MARTEGRGRRATFVRPHGPLVDESAGALKEEVRAALSSGRDVVVDLSAVTFMDSAGLSALVAGFKAATASERRLVLCGARTNVRSLLALTRLHRVLEVYSDATEAALAVHGKEV